MSVFGRDIWVRIFIYWGLVSGIWRQLLYICAKFFVSTHFFTNFAFENKIERPVTQYMTAPSPNDDDDTLPNFMKCALSVVLWKNRSCVIDAVLVSLYLFFIKTLLITTWAWRNMPAETAGHCLESNSDWPDVYPNACPIIRYSILFANKSYIK